MNSTSPKQNLRHGFTLIELVFVIAILGILIGMMLPAVRRTRGAARRTQCANNARQIAIAMHRYESTHQYLPPAVGTFDTSGRWLNNDTQTSAFVALLSYLDEGSLLDDIQDSIEPHSEDGPIAISLSPQDEDFLPWQVRLEGLTCPASATNSQSVFGQTSYAFSIGDVARDLASAPQRGAMTTHSPTYMDDITDGTSSTILLTEVCSSYTDPFSKIVVENSTNLLDNPSLVDKFYDRELDNFKGSVRLLSDLRGKSWADGAAASTLMNTILPPQSGSCVISEARFADGFYSASSAHPNNTIVAFVDGSVHHIAQSIDAGNPTASPLTAKQYQRESPHGIWGALGSIRGGEVIEDY